MRNSHNDILQESERLIKIYNGQDNPDSAFDEAMQDGKGHLYRIDDKLRVAQRLLFLAREFIIDANKYHDPKNLDFVNSDWDSPTNLIKKIDDEIEKMKEKIK